MSRRALLIVALFYIPVVCQGADLAPYLGAAIGQGVEIDAAEEVGADSSGPSFKLFGGIGIGENFAVEIAYHDFGTTDCCGPSYADLGFRWNGGAFSASAMVLLPINRFRLFARAGALWWTIDGDVLTIAGPQPFSNDGVDLLAGVGGDIRVVGYLRIRLEWERFNLNDSDADSVMIGTLWQF